MDDKQFLQFLADKQLLAPDKISFVLRDAEMAEKDVEILLYESNLVDDVEVAKAKAERFNIPYKAVDADTITEEVIKLVPAEVARNYHFIPLQKKDDTLIVGMLKPKDMKALEALKFIGQQSKLNLGVYVISYSDFEEVMHLYSPFKSEVEEALRAVEEQAEGTDDVSTYRTVALEDKNADADSAPIIKLVASIFKNAVAERTSDIHIEPQRNRLRVRFRMDGELREILTLPLKLHQPVVSRIKVLSNLKIDENRRPQDGRFRTEIFNKEIDFRVSTLPTAVGEKVVMRVLDPTSGLKSVEELGLMGRNFDVLQKSIKEPYGMILITGPTGSGKTTTLYSILRTLNQEDVNVISLEDPVEYTIEGLNQSQMMPEIGYTFASGLRTVLRQDPDIIMVGEIRDGETAELAVNAALTGHLVLSTLHTNNAMGVIPRLLDMGVDAFLLAPALNLMLAQRLVGKICEACKQPKEASGDYTAIINHEIETLPPSEREKVEYKEPYTVYEAPGCQECNQKGIVGRIGVFEILKMTPSLEEIVATGISDATMLKEAKDQGMITLRQDGILKALGGQTTMEEVVRETSESR